MYDVLMQLFTCMEIGIYIGKKVPIRRYVLRNKEDKKQVLLF
jgi:hypothetical protein